MTEEQSETIFLNKSRFTKMVEHVRIDKKLSYIDSVLYLCDVHKIDEEDAKKYISNVIKEKIEAEAMKLNMIPRVNTLPIDD